MTVSLVDRAAEFEVLEDALSACVVGVEPRRAVIFGDAGTGKTALANALARYAEERFGAAVVVGAGSPMSQGSSYLPFRQLIEALCGFQRRGRTDVDSTAVANMRATQIAGVRALVDEAPELIGTVVPPLAPSVLRALDLPTDLVDALATLSDPRRTHEALSDTAQISQLIAAVLGTASLPSPLVVIVEDLHWCDPGSVQLFGDLQRDLGPHAIFSIATTRRESAELAPRVSLLLSALVRGGETGFVDLDRAVSERAGEFCRLLLLDRGLAVGAQVAEAMIERTGGNPLFATGIVDRLTVERDSTKDFQLSAIELPERLSALIDDRLRSLPDDAQVLLEVGAVEGCIFTPDVVSEVLGRPLIEILNTLDRVLRYQHRIVEDVSGSGQTAGPPRYRFPHGLYREHIYANRIGPARRSELHRLIAETLERKHGLDPSLVTYSELAEHYSRGGDRGKASDYFGRSAEVSAGMADFDAAFDLVQHAFAELPDDREPQPRTLLTAASTYRVRGLFSDAGRVAERGLALPDLEEGIRVRLMSEQARSFYNRDERMADAIDLLGRATELAQGLGEDRLEADLQRQLGVALQRQGRCLEATRAYRAALQLASQSEDAGLVADITNAIGVCLNLAGHFRDARDFHDAARRVAAEANFDLRMTLFLNDSVAPLRRVGKGDAALSASTRSAELARLQGKPGAVARALHERALCEMYGADRDVDRVIALLDEVFATEGELQGQGPTISYAYYDRVLLELARGEFDNALEWLARSGSHSKRWVVTGTSDMRSASLIRFLCSPKSRSARQELSSTRRELTDRGIECWAWAALVNVSDAVEERPPKYDLSSLLESYPAARRELDCLGHALVRARVLGDTTDPWIGSGEAFPDTAVWRPLITDLREVIDL